MRNVQSMARTGGLGDCARDGALRRVRLVNTRSVRTSLPVVCSAGVPSVIPVGDARAWIGFDCSATTLQHDAVSIWAIDPPPAEVNVGLFPMQQAWPGEQECIAQIWDANPGTPVINSRRTSTPILNRRLIFNLNRV